MSAAPLPAAERARVLDFEHRKRERSVWPRVLSLRYLMTALGRLGRGTVAIDAAPVARPPAGTVSITFVGHATVRRAEGRLIEFSVVARDQREEIGSGVHERVVVDLVRLAKRLDAKQG